MGKAAAAVAVVMLGLTAAASPAMAGDAGQSMFAGRCGACHQITPKSGPAAPSLKGVYGRKVASLNDFAYSSALKAKGGVWSEARLGDFLSSPSTFAPGTKMPVSVPSASDRIALIGYLKTVK